MEINVRDYFKIDDSHSKVRGFVFAYEGDKLIFHKENMITEYGRRLIFNAVFGSTIKLSDFKVAVGTGTNMTTPDMEELQAINTNIKVSNLVIKKSEDGDLRADIQFDITLNGNEGDSIKISELGLFNGEPITVEYNEDGEPTTEGNMFSRVVFQPYTLTYNTTLTFKYYIYF